MKATTPGFSQCWQISCKFIVPILDCGVGDGVGVGVVGGVTVGGMFWDTKVVGLLSKTITVTESATAITSSTIAGSVSLSKGREKGGEAAEQRS